MVARSVNGRNDRKYKVFQVIRPGKGEDMRNRGLGKDKDKMNIKTNEAWDSSFAREYFRTFPDKTRKEICDIVWQHIGRGRA